MMETERVVVEVVEVVSEVGTGSGTAHTARGAADQQNQDIPA